MEAEILSGFVYSMHLNGEALAGLLRTVFGSRKERPECVLLRADDRQFGPLEEGVEAELIAAWDQGRTFDPALEIRWRKRTDGYSVHLLAEQKLPADMLEQAHVTEWDVWTASDDAGHGMILWGTGAPEMENAASSTGGSGLRFREARLSRAVDLPSTASQRKISYYLYRDRESAAVKWVRLRKVL